MAAFRVPLYALLNLAFILYAGVAAAIGSAGNPRVLYVGLLFAICSTPLLLVKKGNDRFSLYTIFMGMYFISFGILDVLTLSSSAANRASTGLLSSAELLIILGGVAFALGYLVSAGRRAPSAFATEDYPLNVLVTVGLVLWAVGMYATWFWNIQLTVRAGEANFNIGELFTTILMMGRYATPLGLLAVAYAYTISGSKFLTLITIALASVGVVLGFASDTKGGAMSAGIMVLVTGFLVKGKVPKSWAIAGVLFVIFAFPVFQAHRAIVVGERGASNASTAQNLEKALELSIAGEERVAAGHAESFFERSSVKSAVEMIVGKTGESVPYQHGYTLIPLATMFIPRLIWPNKPDVQTGLLVDKAFHVTGLGGGVYISPSHLGELYWNFGWPGALAGMLLLGMLLGWINYLCDMSVSRSVTRLLILAITIYQTGVRFEGSIASEYAVWGRSVAGILIMHWMFARGRGGARSSTTAVAALPPHGAAILGRFPNLLR